MEHSKFKSRPHGGRSQSSWKGPRQGGFSRPKFGRSRPGFSSGGRGKGRPAGPALDISRFINKKSVITEDAPLFQPEHAFTDFKVEEKLKKNITAKGYIQPTPIQDRIIPHILKGQDVVGIANTGTGKTAAFLIPLINKIIQNPDEQVLVVVPTRELATQIADELKGFAFGLNIFSVVVVGGAPINAQIRAFRYKNQFVIGTPGRLKDLIERKVLNLAGFGTVVLDEADRMLDMGFINDMKFLMARMKTVRHTLFFSATMSPEIKNLVSAFLKDPVTVSVKTQETAANVEQDIVRVGDKDKLDVLHDLLVQPEFSRVLIFGRTKHGTERLSKMLLERGFKAESIHGNKNFNGRQRALKSFKDGSVQILVATDVAARGLDIADVSHVINYDMPATHDDYVHRIGRTGRGSKKGKALTFV